MTRAVDVLPNGLRMHRIGLAGTRAVTVVVAFDAGSRTELPQEHGIAHFLEHLVFKGGQSYSDSGAITGIGQRLIDSREVLLVLKGLRRRSAAGSPVHAAHGTIA